MSNWQYGVYKPIPWLILGQRLVGISSGIDEPSEAHYMEGSGDVTSRERRFLGWFALTFKLPDGRSPAELAANAILHGGDLTSAIDSIKGSRYLLAMVTMVNPGKGLILKLEDEDFNIDNRQSSRLLSRDDALFAHIISPPDGSAGWLVLACCSGQCTLCRVCRLC